MLSNLKFQQELDLTSYGYTHDLIFTFHGKSMENLTDINSAKESILVGDETRHTIINCLIEDCLIGVINETVPIDDKMFVVQSFFNDPFLAKIKTVASDWIMFKFHNPDKTMFPNQYLRVSEIKSIHQVTKITYNRQQKDWCHCGSESDWCGEGCCQPQNKDSLLGMDKGGHS